MPSIPSGAIAGARAHHSHTGLTIDTNLNDLVFADRSPKYRSASSTPTNSEAPSRFVSGISGANSEGWRSEDSYADATYSEPVPQESRRSVSDEQWRHILESSGLPQPDQVGHLLSETFLDGPAFTAVLGVMISANVIVIGLECDWNRDQDQVAFYVLEIFFMVFWTFEAAAHLYFQRLRYFASKWNLLDFSLVSLTLFEVLIVPLIDGPGSAKWGIFRVLRILRILRLLRLVKRVTLCRELWMILLGFVEALKTLGWVLLLLLIVVYSGGMFMTNQVGHQCDTDYAAWSDCHDIFGTVLKSMFSLFQVISMESWSMQIARPVLKESPWLFFFFLTFLMLTTFGMLNIIVGVIVENTLQAANDEQLAQARLREQQILGELLEMRTVFEEADEDSNGDVDVEEFRNICQRSEVVEKLERFDIPCHDPDQLFEMLDQDGGGTISIFEFCEGISRLRAPPTASDLRTAASRVSCSHQGATKAMETLDMVAKAMGFDVSTPPVSPAKSIDGEMFKRQESPCSSLSRSITAASQTPKSASTSLPRTLAALVKSSKNSQTGDENSPKHLALPVVALEAEPLRLPAAEHENGFSAPVPSGPEHQNGVSDAFGCPKTPRAAGTPRTPPLETPPETTEEIPDVGQAGAERGAAKVVPRSNAPVAEPDRLLSSRNCGQTHAALAHGRCRLQVLEQSIESRLARLEKLSRNLTRNQTKIHAEVGEVLQCLSSPVVSTSSGENLSAEGPAPD